MCIRDRGVTAAALGCLLKARGYRVSMQKLNLYYNAEPAFLSPLEHGEAFITEDGHCLLYTSGGTDYSTPRAQWPSVVSKAAGAQGAPDSSAA